MRAGKPRAWLWILGFLAVAAPRAWAEEAAPPAVPGSTGRPEAAAPAAPAAPAAAAPAAFPVELRVREETVAVSLADNRNGHVTLRVPVSIQRPANHFRLYGLRPLTLWDRDRRRDLYRDAFLEVATRARVSAGVNAWADLLKQLDWLGARSSSAPASGPAAPPSAGTDDPARRVQELARQALQSPAYPNVAAVTRALGQAGAQALPEVAQPVAATLQLRALATDEALRRLELTGQALGIDGPGVDPALRDGYRAARSEFDEVRQGLWPALAASVRKNQGQLVLGTVKQFVLSRLGFWAIFGYAGWQSAESALNVEYHGQYAICLATLDFALSQGAPRVPGAAAGPDPRPLALYTEYVLNYELTEALKTGGVMPLQPAGGRTTGDWQVRLSSRCDELRKVIAVN